VGKDQHDFLDLLDTYLEDILSNGVVENTICKYTDGKDMGISLLPGRKRKDG